MKKMKKAAIKAGVGTLLALMISVDAMALHCPNATVTHILTGPRHGAMALVHEPGRCHLWVCLDPDGEVMSERESDRLFDFMMNAKNLKKKININMSDGVHARACNGGYPVVEDARDR